MPIQITICHTVDDQENVSICFEVGAGHGQQALQIMSYTCVRLHSPCNPLLSSDTAKVLGEQKRCSITEKEPITTVLTLFLLI